MNCFTTLHVRIILGNASVQRKLCKVYYEGVTEVKFALINSDKECYYRYLAFVSWLHPQLPCGWSLGIRHSKIKVRVNWKRWIWLDADTDTDTDTDLSQMQTLTGMDFEVHVLLERLILRAPNLKNEGSLSELFHFHTCCGTAGLGQRVYYHAQIA